MKKPINLLIISLFILISACNKEEDISKDLLLESINSIEFINTFKLCEKGFEKPINIFSDIKQFEDSFDIKLNKCNRSLNFSKINFKYDVNDIKRKNNRGIVLYKYDNKSSNHKFYFLSLKNNASLILIYTEDKKLIDKKTGVF